MTFLWLTEGIILVSSSPKFTFENSSSAISEKLIWLKLSSYKVSLFELVKGGSTRDPYSIKSGPFFL